MGLLILVLATIGFLALIAGAFIEDRSPPEDRDWVWAAYGLLALPAAVGTALLLVLVAWAFIG